MNDTRSFNVQIEVQSNGYILRPAYDPRRDIGPSPSDTKVFESFENLVAHLRAALPIYPALQTWSVTIPASDPPKRQR